MFTPGNRLNTAASLLCGSRKTVDVGTDHAYLPAFLVLNGICEDVLACDIGEMPLENARKTVSEYALEKNIRLRISDGLKNVSPQEAEEITVCGMGGTLIAQILSDCEWIKKDALHLVLQPMTHSEDVRRFLCENGFTIEKEICVEDASRVYCLISAFYTAQNERYEDGYMYFGTLIEDKSKAAVKYIEKQLGRVKKRRQALESCGRNADEVLMLTSVIDYYERRKNG